MASRFLRLVGEAGAKERHPHVPGGGWGAFRQACAKIEDCEAEKQEHVFPEEWAFNKYKETCDREARIAVFTLDPGTVLKAIAGVYPLILHNPMRWVSFLHFTDGETEA